MTFYAAILGGAIAVLLFLYSTSSDIFDNLTQVHLQIAQGFRVFVEGGFLNAVGKSDLTNYMKYMQALESFHEELRLSFYQKIFEEQPIQDEDWDRYNLESFSDERDVNVVMLIPLLLANLILIGLAKLSFRKAAIS